MKLSERLLGREADRYSIERGYKGYWVLRYDGAYVMGYRTLVAAKAGAVELAAHIEGGLGK